MISFFLKIENDTLMLTFVKIKFHIYTLMMKYKQISRLPVELDKDVIVQVLFVLITYYIIEQLYTHLNGFNNNIVKIVSLFYADDVLILAEDEQKKEILKKTKCFRAMTPTVTARGCNRILYFLQRSGIPTTMYNTEIMYFSDIEIENI